MPIAELNITTGEKKKVLIPYEKYEIILKEKNKEDNTTVKTMPIQKFLLPFHSDYRR